jgi:hypothetical protein
VGDDRTPAPHRPRARISGRTSTSIRLHWLTRWP